MTTYCRPTPVSLTIWRLLAVTVVSVVLVQAHPGAVAQGRATCGSEYSTPNAAYWIPDIGEAWYLRRISTCDEPVFWTSFDITQAQQQLYIATISPDIDRFRDNLQFHGILYGPGVGVDEANGFYAIPDTLPSKINLQDNLGGAAYLKPPASLAVCDFVDTNPVMKDFSDVIGGRCMEEFTFDVNYKNQLMQGATVFNWWLYSFNHRAPEPGTYYLQTWLTPTNDTTSTIPGKYEMTLAPWNWFRYATQETLQRAQSQGTSCSCAYNEIDYRERLLTRLGGVDAGLFQSQLSADTCSASAAETSSLCYTIDKQAYRSEDSAIEWSGILSLKANTTYEWSYFAYYQGRLEGGYDYPDPGMLVYLVESSDIESVAAIADAALKDGVIKLEEDEVNHNITTRANGDVVTIGDELQYILFANVSETTNTTVLLQPTSDMDIAVFTQHVPSEFMAHVVKNQATGEYVFPTSQTLYSDDVPPKMEDDNSGDSGNNSSGLDSTSGTSTRMTSSISFMLLGLTAFMLMSMSFDW